MNDVKRIGIKSLWSGWRNFLSIRIEIFKLSFLAKGSKLVADLLTSAVLFFSVMFTILAAMATLAFYLSKLFKSYTMGFGITAQLFVLLACLVLWKKDAFEKLFAEIFVKRYFKEHCDNGQEKACETKV